MKNITDRCALVLQQIDAALEVAKKATPGPWTQYITAEWPPGWIGVRQNVASDTLTETHVATVGRVNDAEHDVAFIATSRTLLPNSLRCLKTAMQAIAWYNDSAEDKTERKIALRTLTTLCEQWEASR